MGVFRDLRKRIELGLRDRSIDELQYCRDRPIPLTAEQVVGLFSGKTTLATAREWVTDPVFTPTIALYIRILLWYAQGNGNPRWAFGRVESKALRKAFRRLGEFADNQYHPIDYHGKGWGFSDMHPGRRYSIGRSDWSRAFAHVGGYASDSDSDY